MPQRDTIRAVNETLRAVLARRVVRVASTTTQKTGQRLSPSLSATLVNLIRCNPDESDDRIRALFHLATGYRVSTPTVRRRRPLQGERNPFRRLTAREDNALNDLVDDCPGLSAEQIASLCPGAVGRSVTPKTVRGRLAARAVRKS